jgi:hypothetical protein
VPSAGIESRRHSGFRKPIVHALKNMVPPAGIEPAAPGLGNSSGSNQSDPSKNPE